MIKDFRRIPGVGKSIAQDFIDLGFTSVEQLKGQNPEKLYQDLCLLKKCHVDRCMLYVYLNNFKSWFWATRKLSEFADLKWPHIINIRPFKIGELRCFGTAENPIFKVV